MIEFTCSSCRNTLQVDDCLSGQPAQCPACARISNVPTRRARPVWLLTGGIAGCILLVAILVLLASRRKQPQRPDTAQRPVSSQAAGEPSDKQKPVSAESEVKPLRQPASTPVISGPSRLKEPSDREVRKQQVASSEDTKPSAPVEPVVEPQKPKEPAWAKLLLDSGIRQPWSDELGVFVRMPATNLSHPYYTNTSGRTFSVKELLGHYGPADATETHDGFDHYRVGPLILVSAKGSDQLIAMGIAEGSVNVELAKAYPTLEAEARRILNRPAPAPLINTDKWFTNDEVAKNALRLPLSKSEPGLQRELTTPDLLINCVDGIDALAVGGGITREGKDNIVVVWDLLEGKELQRFRGHQAPIRSIAISDSSCESNCNVKGKFILSASEDKTVRLWYTPTGQEIRQFVHPGPVSCVLWATRHSAYSVCSDGILRRLELGSGEMAVLGQPESVMKSLTLFARKSAYFMSPGSARLAASSEDGSISIWDLARNSDEPTQRFVGHKGRITGLWGPFWMNEISKGNLMSTGIDGTIRSWNTENGKEGSWRLLPSTSSFLVCIENGLNWVCSNNALLGFNYDGLFHKIEAHKEPIVTVSEVLEEVGDFVLTSDGKSLRLWKLPRRPDSGNPTYMGPFPPFKMGIRTDQSISDIASGLRPANFDSTKVTITNNKDYCIQLGLREGDSGVDIFVPAHETRNVPIVPGTYVIYLAASPAPRDVYRGDCKGLNYRETLYIELQNDDSTGGTIRRGKESYRLRKVN